MSPSLIERRRARQPPPHIPVPVVRPRSRDGRAASQEVGWVVQTRRVYWYGDDWETELLGRSERMTEAEAKALAAHMGTTEGTA